MGLGEFVPSRVVEAVVHGFDLTDALGRDTIATPKGTAIAAGILDELLARRTVPGGRATSPTTWPGCAPRRAGRRTTTRGCR